MGHFIPFLQTYPGPGATTPCGPDTCTGTRCSCTHTLKLDLGNVIEMVIFSFGKNVKDSITCYELNLKKSNNDDNYWI